MLLDIKMVIGSRTLALNIGLTSVRTKADWSGQLSSSIKIS